MDKPKLWMSLFIVGMLVMSTVGFVMNYSIGDGRTVNYNGTIFKVNDKGVFTTIDGQRVGFDYLPANVEGIEMDPVISPILESTLMVYMVYDYNSSSANYIAQSEFALAKAFEEQFNVYSAAGFIEETGTMVPKITCANATASVPVIYFKDSNETKISFQDNCILAEASTASDFPALKDRMLYEMFGIIE